MKTVHNTLVKTYSCLKGLHCFKMAPKSTKSAPKAAKSAPKKFIEDLEEVVEMVDEKDFVVKPTNSKCKGHKFHGLMVCDLGDSFAIRSSGDKPIVFHCKCTMCTMFVAGSGLILREQTLTNCDYTAGDDERIMEAFGDLEDDKETLCKNSPLTVSDLPLDDEEPKAKSAAAPGAAGANKAKKATKPAKPAQKAAPKAVAAKPAVKAPKPAKASKKPAAGKKSSKK